MKLYWVVVPGSPSLFPDLPFFSAAIPQSFMRSLALLRSPPHKLLFFSDPVDPPCPFPCDASSSNPRDHLFLILATPLSSGTFFVAGSLFPHQHCRKFCTLSMPPFPSSPELPSTQIFSSSPVRLRCGRTILCFSPIGSHFFHVGFHSNSARRSYLDFPQKFFLCLYVAFAFFFSNELSPFPN